MRVFWAELVRAFRLRTLWLTALVGVGLAVFIFAFMWIGHNVTSADQAREVCDMLVSGGVASPSLVAMIMGGLAVTRDYRWPWMGRLRRMAPNAGLVAAKSAAVAVFAAVTGIIAICVGLAVAAVMAPDGYTLSTSESLWKIAAGGVLCCPFTCLVGCAIGFILQRRLLASIVNFALLFFPAIWDGKPAGKYVSWDTLAASLTFDPSMPVKLPFWGAVLVLLGYCALFFLLALAVMRVRTSTVRVGRRSLPEPEHASFEITPLSRKSSVRHKIDNVVVRLTLADLVRSRHTVALWAVAAGGIAFTCVMTWAMLPLPSPMLAADVRPYCDSFLGTFASYSLFSMIMSGVLVTRDYDSGIIAREARMAVAGGLIAVKALTSIVWCAASTLVMIGANLALLQIRLSQRGLTWDASHGVFAVLGGNLVLAIASSLCGVGLGFVLRSTIGTVLVQVLAVYVLTPFLIRFSVAAYIHLGLGASLIFGLTTIDKLAFWQACLVEAGWCAVFLAAALVTMRVRSSRS